MAHKGEIVSAESRAKMSAAKAKRFKSKCEWELAEPYLHMDSENYFEGCISVLKHMGRIHPLPQGEGRSAPNPVKNESAFRFLSLIEPYVIPSMRYKVDYEEYVKWRQAKAALNS